MRDTDHVEQIDWATRQAAALLPFTLAAGRPVRPGLTTPTKTGRGDLRCWGENAMADAIVTLTHAGRQYLLMVDRSDRHGWAVPGGHIDPGETPLIASSRELHEETGLIVPPSAWTPGTPAWVDDPRGTDEAWAVTVANTADLGDRDFFPTVIGSDDANQADWIPANTYPELVTDLEHRGGRVFAAHIAMLQQHLGGAL